MSQTDKVLCFGHPKEAALYFEQVMPIDFAYGWFGLFENHGSDLSREAIELGIPLRNPDQARIIVEGLMPKTHDAFELYSNLWLLSAWVPLAFIFGKSDNSNFFEKASQEEKFKQAIKMLSDEADVSLPEIVRAIRLEGMTPAQISKIYTPKLVDFISKSEFAGSPRWLASEDSAKPVLVNEVDPAISYAVSIRGLSLVDPAKCSWQQILDFRKDKDSMLALKRFRFFFVENFSSKSASYISDKLNVLVDDYEKTTKLWGFNTIEKTLSAAFEKDSVVGASIGALAPVLAGAPLSVAAACGSVVTIGKCALAFSRIFVDNLVTRNQNPVSYLSKLTNLSST